ncbi:MAG TPA: pyridoxal phosphate-dependent aminotransferase [Methylomirabilota bacterium]|nr:pyridoxal phosphate-dependent aminotransferase [Methylomirabilota bacterium]
MLAKRVIHLLPSPTMMLDTKAKELQGQGTPIINLTAGEPDFQTPQHIKNAAIQAIEQGITRYTSPQGILALRQAIVQKFEKENNIRYEPSEIIVGAGSKQILYTAFQVLCDIDDEVLIPLPTWSTFVEQVKLAGGKPVLIKLQPPFKMTATAIEKHITTKTKILLLNSPSNPTGTMIDDNELKKIAKLAVEKNLWIISDEIYEKLIYTNNHLSIASLNEKVKSHTITIGGVSKSYAMTGWRLGYAGGPKEVITAMAALAALKEEQQSVNEMKNAFMQRRTYLLEQFATMPQFSVIAPEGAFYLFVSVEKLLGKTYQTSSAWCKALLEKAHVAVVPGEAFLYPGYFRLSFAASMEDLKKAVEKMKNFITIYET